MDRWKRVAVALLFIGAMDAVAQGRTAGAISGFGSALEDVGRSMLDFELQRQLLQEHHNLETQRIERLHDLQREHIRSEYERRGPAARSV